MSIKLITIDFWNTLFDSSNGLQRNNYRLSVLKDNIGQLGIELSEKDYEEVMRASWHYFNTVWTTEHRTPRPHETVEYFWHKFNLPQDDDKINNIVVAFADCILKYRPQLIHGVKPALAKLSEFYDLAIVSDTGFSPGSTLKILLRDEGILQYFTAFSFSDETGVSKPHPKAFKTVLNMKNCAPANSLHIGDIEKTDVVGAKQIGMRAIRFNGDPTSMMNKENSHETLADAEANSWREVMEIIQDMN